MSDITRSEAIKQLRLLKADITHGLAFISKTKDKHPALESLDMAIASLETDEFYQLEYESTKNDGVDAVSRADARSLICKIDIKHHLSGMSRKAFKDLYNGIDELPSVTPQFSSGLEKNSQKLENSTKKYCGCCTHWKRKGVKKIGDKPTSYGKCTKLSISGFEVETTYNDDCSSEGLE